MDPPHPGLRVFLLSLLLGLVLLVTGAELLVRGGGQLALALRIPALVVGLTVVAFGTSAPELVVSITAALEGSTDMALANINGSNLANIALVLGGAALIRPMTVERSMLNREVPVCVALQILLPLLCLDGVIGRWDGLIFVAFGVAWNAWLVRDAMRGRSVPVDGDVEASSGASWVGNVVKVLGGLVILVVGADLFVSGAHTVAVMAGLSERFIGLTVVAVGTSAPEIATGFVSAWRGESDIALGNSLGSNLFNIAIVLGLTALVHPVAVSDPGSFTDMATALVVTLALVPIVRAERFGRPAGLLFVLGYVGYLAADLVT